MIAFELSMPGRGSWDGRWGGDGCCYVRTVPSRRVPAEVVGHDFYYRWDDGWCACVSVRKVSPAEARSLKKRSQGFHGYDWMIDSIIAHGDIRIVREAEK